MEDSDDYELMPHQEIEQLRRDVNFMKKNPYGESGKSLHEAVERLNSSINKLVSILEDAQQDIIDEYQESKPTEKLNQILDQNETIAKALLSINDNLKGVDAPKTIQRNFNVQNDVPDTPNLPPMPPMRQPQRQQFVPQRQFVPQPNMQQNFRPQRPMQQPMDMPPLQPDMPSLPPLQEMPQQNDPGLQFNDLPPLDSPVESEGLPPVPPKKKFLGLM